MDWLGDGRAVTLPFDSLLTHVHQCGKHFLDTVLLDELVVAAGRVSDDEDRAAEALAFLRMLVDRHTDTYCYDSYLGMDFVLGLADPGADCFREHARRRGAQIVALLADIILLECHTYLGYETRFTERIPSGELGAQRIRGAIAALQYFADGFVPEIAPDVARLLKVDPAGTDEPSRDWLRCNAEGSAPLLYADGRRSRALFELAAIPMSRDHDEYMFIRVVQLFELCFNIVIRGLEDAIRALDSGRIDVATERVSTLVDVMRGSGRLFRVLTTMTPEAFLAFRPYTSGSSAVASRQIKHVEVLCQRPPEPRLASEAFSLVPAVVALYRGGIASLETALPGALAAADAAEGGALIDALDRFNTSWVGWKKAHFGIAMRWLGAMKGTGGTEGIPYLQRYVADPLLPFLDAARASLPAGA